MQSIHILVASTSSAFLHAATLILRHNIRSAEVQEAQTGQEAVERVKTSHPDVVLLDVELPALNLVEIVSQLRGQSYMSRIVFMTLDDVTPYRAAASQFGLAGVIDKAHFAEEVEAFLAAIP